MDNLTETEVLIQTMLNEGKYMEAQKVLEEKRYSVRLVPRAIFGATIALALGKLQLAWEEIKNGLRADAYNYELYFMLGEYLMTKNMQQAYLCYENALFYCPESDERKQISLVLQELKEQGVSVPPTAIVILSFEGKELVEDCLESIRKTIPESAREIIVVDNASADECTGWLKAQPDIKLLCNEENMGISKGYNQGIALANADTDILLLHQDTFMTPNALFWLRMGLYEEERNGSAGCVSNCAADFQSVIEAGKTKAEYWEYAEKNNILTENLYLNKISLDGFALLLKRTVLNEIGFLDESFFLGDYADNDICLRIALAGYRNVMCKNSFVMHWGCLKLDKTTNDSDSIRKKSEKLFFDKWAKMGIYPSMYLNTRMDIAMLLDDFQMSDKTVAVLGTGDGTCLSCLKQKFPSVQIFGIEQQYFQAKLSDSIADTIWTDLNQWKSDELLETFDIIIINDVLELTQNPETVLKEIGRMLKKDGRMILSFVNGNHFSKIENSSIRSQLFSKEKIEKMLHVAKFSLDNWVYTHFIGNEEKFQENILKMEKRFPEISRQDLVAYQWIAVARPQRDDICFGNKMVVCIPTYEHPETIEDVLSHCAETYKRYGLNVYYYDSSRDDRTKCVIEKYQKEGYDNLHYIKKDPKTRVYEKTESIFKLEDIKEKYTYIWLVKDRCWCNENTLQLIHRAVSEKHDLVFLDVGHPNCGKEYSICNDANEFYHRCGGYATSMDTTIYHVSSILKEDMCEFQIQHPKGGLYFFHFQLIFEQLAKKKIPDICLLTGADVAICNSVKSSSLWGDKRIDIWGKRWIDANEELPDCYDNKEEVIKRTASFPWLLGSAEPLIELHEKGILTPEYYEEIKDWWERVSVIELETLKKIAYGEYK